MQKLVDWIWFMILLALCITLIAELGCSSNRPAAFGERCSEDSDCADGVCARESGTTKFPEGMCTAECTGQSDCDEGVCVTDGTTAYCYPQCHRHVDCREGYRCLLIGLFPVKSICYPVTNL